MGAGVVVVAAGVGRRLGEAGGGPKALLPIGGRPLLTHALVRLRRAAPGPIVVVHTPGHEDDFRAAVADADVEAILTPGGVTRSDSVRAGLAVLPGTVDVVAVHDAARALVPPSVVAATIDAIGGRVIASVPGFAVPDSLKAVDADSRLTRTVDREGVYAVQTPQTFARVTLDAAYRWAAGRSTTDDLGMVEAARDAGVVDGDIVVVPGSPWAMKVTYAADLEFASALLRSGEAPA